MLARRFLWSLWLRNGILIQILVTKIGTLAILLPSDCHWSMAVYHREHLYI